METDHETWMRQAIAEGELARGSTGDNPWVGCVIVDAPGKVVGRGHTQGPGEDHAEIEALAQAEAAGISLAEATLYSTLEPCSFHGRTPACSRAILARGVRRVVLGMRDPHPRVDGEGARILRDGGATVLEGVCEAEVRRQLGPWVFTFHPHEPLRRAGELSAAQGETDVAAALMQLYAVDLPRALEVARRARGGAVR